MTPHEEKMLDEIHQLQSRLAAAEKSRLLWKVLAIFLCLVLVAAVGFAAFVYLSK